MKQLKYIMSATFFALSFTNAADIATSSNNSSMQDKEIRLAECEATQTLQKAIELLIYYHSENQPGSQNGYGHPVMPPKIKGSKSRIIKSYAA